MVNTNFCKPIFNIYIYCRKRLLVFSKIEPIKNKRKKRRNKINYLVEACVGHNLRKTNLPRASVHCSRQSSLRCNDFLIYVSSTSKRRFRYSSWCFRTSKTLKREMQQDDNVISLFWMSGAIFNSSVNNWQSGGVYL